ncbi:MAG TPA: hypothetical protein VNI61_01195, partial [Gemmatimonadales bacterium]|nr:hypothetical protein [Gemmatimonadales bacterium]
WPRTGHAQAARDPRVDSLLAEIRALKARLDSLARRDTTGDALAQLRARAQAAAQRDTAPAPAVAGPRNLNQLNPEISVTGDLRALARTQGPQQDNFDLSEVEFSFQAALDPYSHTKIFAGLHGDEIEVEEAYFYYTGLPGRLRLDLGVFRQQIGELNRWHLHALPETDYPLALATYTGEEGLVGTGLSAYWGGSILGTQELWVQGVLGDNQVLFDGGNRPAVLAHLNNFWNLGRAAYVQLGVTGMYGENPDSGLRTTLSGVDARFTWRPPERAKYREWTLRGELYRIEKERAGPGDAAEARYGFYAGTQYKLGARWWVGVRYDYVEAPEGPLAVVRQVIPSLTFWQSEWVRLHAEWRWRREAGVNTSHLVLQGVWAMGPHKHELF